MSNWIDITTTVENGMVHWPGDADVEVYKSASMEEGSDANVTNIRMSAHTGTHVDAPLHFIKDGKDISSLSLERMTGRAHVIRVNSRPAITKDDISKYNLSEGDCVIFRTANSAEEWTMKPFRDDYVYLSTEAAHYLVEKKIKTVGVDYLSVAGEENGAEVHRILLSNEILIIEGLMLKDVQEGIFEFVCLPMKLKGSDGAPARVIIRKK